MRKDRPNFRQDEPPSGGGGIFEAKVFDPDKTASTAKTATKLRPPAGPPPPPPVLGDRDSSGFPLSPAPEVKPAPERGDRSKRKNAWWLIGGGVVVLGVACGVGVIPFFLDKIKMLPSNTMPTGTPTLAESWLLPTITLGPDLEATVTAQGIDIATLRASQAQPTLLPTFTLPTVDNQRVWSGQGGFNQFRRDFAGEEIAFMAYLESLISKAQVDRIDSAYTALVNGFKGPQFDVVADPLKETGMELDASEIQKIRDSGNIYNVLFFQDYNVSELMQPLSRDPNKVFMGVWGRGHERDAITAVLASALRYQYWLQVDPSHVDENERLFDSITLNQASVEEIAQWQQLIVERTRNRDLGTSATELDRRGLSDSDEASHQINSMLRLDDQIEVCEEVRGASTNGTRDGQPQTLVVVNHIAGGRNTFEEADVSGEIMLFVLVFDKETMKWDVVAITSRGFSNDPLAGDVSEAVSANEMEPCARAQVPPGPTPTATVPPANTPSGNVPPPVETTPPPEVPPTFVPTQPQEATKEIPPTWVPTQPWVPTP